MTKIQTYASIALAKRGAERAINGNRNPAGKTKFIVKPYEGKFMIDWLSDEMAEFASNEEAVEVEVVDIETPTDSIAVVQVTQAVATTEPVTEDTPIEDPEVANVGEAASTDGRRGKGRKKQGVLDMIERMLTDPSYNDGKGVTLNDMVTEIAAETGRPTEHITATVKTQLSRMPRTRELRITRERIDGVLYYRATRE